MYETFLGASHSWSTLWHAAHIRKNKTFFFATVLVLIYLVVVITANGTRITQTRKSGKGLSFVGPRRNMKVPDLGLVG